MKTKRKVKHVFFLHVFFHKNTNMFTFSGLRSSLLLYFSLKTKCSVRHRFLDICVIFAACCAHLCAFADAASINQTLHLKRSQLKAPLSLSSCNQWNLILLQCAVALQCSARCMEQCRDCTCTNVTTSNFNLHILNFFSQNSPDWDYFIILYIYIYIYI